MLLGAICLIVFVAPSTQYKEEFEGYKVYRLYPDSKSHIQVLQGLQEDDPELDFWTDTTHPGNPVDVSVPPQRQLPFVISLAKAVIKNEVRIHDVATLIKREKLNKESLRFGHNYYDYAKYNTYKEMVRELRFLSQMFPSRTTLQVVGTTHERRKIYAIKIQKDKAKPKSIVFIDCGIHAREWISPATCMYIINQLTAGVDYDNQVKEVLDKFDFIVVPVFNVDGFEHTHTSFRLWRKTRKPYGSCFGADPNRNWDFKWSDGVGTSDNPCSDIYRGPNAFSEVEVRSVAMYLRSIKDLLVSYYNIHAYSQMWLTPWSYTDRHPKDWQEIERVAKVGTKAIKEPFGTNYTHGQPARILYGVSGGSIDWAYAVLGVRYAYALELRDTGRYGFLLPADQILPTGEETFVAIMAAVKAMKV